MPDNAISADKQPKSGGTVPNRKGLDRWRERGAVLFQNEGEGQVEDRGPGNEARELAWRQVAGVAVREVPRLERSKEETEAGRAKRAEQDPQGRLWLEVSASRERGPKEHEGERAAEVSDATERTFKASAD